MTTEWAWRQSLTFIFVPGTIRDQTTVSLRVFCQKEKATSKSYCYSVIWSSGYSWLRAKLKETLSAMSDACTMLFDLSRTMERLIQRGVALSRCCSCILTHLLLWWTMVPTWQPILYTNCMHAVMQRVTLAAECELFAVILRGMKSLTSCLICNFQACTCWARNLHIQPPLRTIKQFSAGTQLLFLEN